MKKIIGILFALILIVNLAVPAQAASVEYEIPELDMAISIPDEYIVFTRDMWEDEAFLSEYGLSKEDFLEALGADTYLDALNPQGTDEIMVTLTEDAEFDTRELGEAGLRILASTIEAQFEEAGLTVFTADIYHNRQLDFIYLYSYAPETDVYTIQYFASYDGKSLFVTLYSYSTAVSEEQETRIRSVVDSITLSSYAPEIRQVEETPAFLYTDEETGTSFTVPAGWKDLGMTEEEDFAYVQFSYSKNPMLIIQYCSIDMYRDMSKYETLTSNKKRYEEMYLEEFMGLENDPKIISYNGVSYSIGERSASYEEYGFPVTAKVTEAVHVENGRLYAFHFLGGMDDPQFGEFEKVLETVEYGDVSSESSEMTVIVIVAGALLVVLIALVLVIKMTQKHAEEKNRECMPQEFVYCQNCGKRLPGDSRFCDSCGVKVSKKEKWL